MQPCSSLPRIYGLIDKSVLDTILYTWKNIEIPPIPRKKEVSITFVKTVFNFTKDTRDIPFVISIIPVVNGIAKSSGICSILNKGKKITEMIFKKLLCLKIDIITENITTKPQIIKIVEIELVILFPKISPKLENEILLFFCFLEFA